MNVLREALGPLLFRLLVKKVKHISISIDADDKTVTIWRQGEPVIIEFGVIEDFVNGTN